MRLEQSEDKLARAISAVKQGRKAEAERLLRAVVREAPRNAEGWLWLGAAVFSPSETLSCLERVLEIEPDNKRAQAGVQWAKAQLSRQRLLTPHPPSPSLTAEQVEPTQTQVAHMSKGDQPVGALLQSVSNETAPLSPVDGSSVGYQVAMHQPPEPAFKEQPTLAGATRPSETALAGAEQVSSHFFPNLIIAVLAVTLLLGLLIILALLRAWLLP